MGYPEQPIEQLPWARGYVLLEKQKNSVLFTMARTKEREHMFKWVGPLSTERQVLIALSKKKVELQSIEDAGELFVECILGDVTGNLLKASGFNAGKLMGVSKLIQNIKKLSSDRIDLIAYSERGFRNYLETNKLDPDKYETVFILKSTTQYFAFHKDVPDSLIQKFQNALDSIQEEHKALLKRYKLSF